MSVWAVTGIVCTGGCSLKGPPSLGKPARAISTVTPFPEAPLAILTEPEIAHGALGSMRASYWAPMGLFSTRGASSATTVVARTNMERRGWARMAAIGADQQAMLQVERGRGQSERGGRGRGRERRGTGEYK